MCFVGVHMRVRMCTYVREAVMRGSRTHTVLILAIVPNQSLANCIVYHISTLTQTSQEPVTAQRGGGKQNTSTLLTKCSSVLQYINVKSLCMAGLLYYGCIIIVLRLYPIL